MAYEATTPLLHRATRSSAGARHRPL